MAAVMQVWYDQEGDFLAFVFRNAQGYYKEIAEDICERVDDQGDLLGYALFNVRRHERQEPAIPLQVQRLKTVLQES